VGRIDERQAEGQDAKVASKGKRGRTWKWPTFRGAERLEHPRVPGKPKDERGERKPYAF
jgi:hypothetical protein